MIAFNSIAFVALLSITEKVLAANGCEREGGWIERSEEKRKSERERERGVDL